MANNAHNLTKPEVYAIFGYTTNFFYGTLNYWARLGINTDKSKEIIDLINSGLKKLPSWNKQNAIYRGIRIRPPNQQEQIILFQHQTILVLLIKYFLSVFFMINQIVPPIYLHLFAMI